MSAALSPVICDFDSTSTGPREWDLTPAAVGKLRFNYPVDTDGQLASAYGFDVITWNGFPVLWPAPGTPARDQRAAGAGGEPGAPGAVGAAVPELPGWGWGGAVGDV
jgi:hypothetical protein